MSGSRAHPSRRRLLPFATRALHLFADAKRAAADGRTPSGALVIGSLEPTAAVHLAPIFAEFVAANPAVELTFKTGTTCELVEQALNCQIDGAFVTALCAATRQPFSTLQDGRQQGAEGPRALQTRPPLDAWWMHTHHRKTPATMANST